MTNRLIAMMKSRQYELIEDALKGRNLSVDGSFVTNEAGIELFARGEEILSDIESVLAEKVLPRFTLEEEENSEFQGLTYVIGAYLVIGFRFDAERLRRFALTMPIDLLVFTTRVFPIFFGKPKGPEFFIFEPSEKVFALLDELCRSTSESLRTAAKFSMKKLCHSTGRT